MWANFIIFVKSNMCIYIERESERERDWDGDKHRDR